MRSLFVVFACLATAACGDDGGLTPLADAPEFTDAGPDAPTTGLVTLTVTQDGVPREGVRVHFQNPDSTLVATMMTDVNGRASATMGIGGFVTALDPFLIPQGGSGPRDIYTYAGVKPGDQLKLNEGNAAATINFDLVFTPDPNSDRFSLFAPCLTGQLDITNTGGSGSGSGGPGGPISLTGCGTTTDITIIGFEPKSGIPHRALHAANVTLTEGGTLDLTASTFTDTTSLLYNYESVPANIAVVNTHSILVTPRGPVYDQDGLSVAVEAGAASLTGTRPTIANTLQVVATTTFGGAHSRQIVIDWGPPTTPYTLAMGNLLNPTILLADYATRPTFAATSHSVSWTADTAGRLADFATAQMFFDRPKVQNWRWSIAAPLTVATATSIAFPVLPTVDEQLNPVDGDNAFVDGLTTAKVPGGYDAVRADVHSINADDPNGIVTGPIGTAVVQELVFNKGRRRPLTTKQALHPFAPVKTRH
ncbi:MAG: hypothetical protein ABI867_10500 [Kofleriaceae bacterium]